MNNTFKYITLLNAILCLANCSSGNGSSSPSATHTPRPSGSSGSSGSSSSSSVSKTFIDTNKFATNLKTANKAKIKSAFEKYNAKATSENKITISDSNFSIASKVLDDKSTIATRKTNLQNALNEYNNNYLPVLTKYNKSKDTYVPLKYNGKYTNRDSATEDINGFAVRLNSIVANTYADFSKLSRKEYVEQTLLGWATAIQKALGKTDTLSTTNIEAQFNTLYSELSTAISTASSNLTSKKADLLAKIKVVDSSITDFPLTIETLMKYYLLEKNILSAIENLEGYVKIPTLSDNSYTAKSFSDTSSDKAVVFSYDSVNKDYILTLKDLSSDTNHIKNRTVAFKASDFKIGTNYYMAEKKDGNYTSSQVSYTFLPNLKSYLNAGGSFDVQTRRKYAENLIKNIQYNVSPTQEEMNLFNNWFGTSYAIGDKITNTNDIKTALSILSKVSANFDITKENTITDIVKIGGRALGLSYSDFGLWTIKGATTFTGDKDLLLAKKDTEAKNNYYYFDTPFFTGFNQFETNFTKQTTAGINTTTVFKGKTFGSATKGDVRKDLSGTATLSVLNQEAKGKLTLNFDKWYTFSFSDINLENTSGFSLTGSTVSVDNTLKSSDILITAPSSGITGNLSGKLYGVEAGKPEEAVGIFDINTTDFVKINGAFGVKK